MKIASLSTDVILKMCAFFVARVLWGGVNSVQFNKFTSLKCDDVAMCATSSPAISFPVLSRAQCGMECFLKTYVGVNYREQDNICEMFSTNPTSFAYNVQGCQYLQKGEVDESLFNSACDINECLTDNGGCSTNAVCTNNLGSFTCACVTGYDGDGFMCSDIDECATDNGGCGSNVCTNTLGSFFCACLAGVSCSVNCVITSPYNFSSYSAAFTSMNYPNSYLDNMDCQWLITASHPYSVVRLSFTEFCTEQNFDYLSVYDGSSRSSLVLMSLSGCSGLPDPVTTSQSYMYVRFTTDSTVSNTGFNATYNMQ